MNAMKVLRALAGLAVLSAATTAWAGGHTYQVTGPVVEASDSSVTVMKGKDKWEIARTPETKVSGELKKGAKATIEYTMTATSVDVKAEKGKAKGKK
jgi:hypothetical protein